jgi:hypothetical protein
MNRAIYFTYFSYRTLVRRFNIKTGTSEKMVDCHALLEGGVQRCGFEAVMPDGSVVLRLTRGDHDVFSLDLDVP